MTPFCIVPVAYFCYKPQSWGMWLSEKDSVRVRHKHQLDNATSMRFFFFLMIWDHYGKRVFSCFLQSVILPVPAACSNLVGIFNKEIILGQIQGYEGHFCGFWNTLSFIHHLCSASFSAVCVFCLSCTPPVFHVIVLVIDDKPNVNQRARVMGMHRGRKPK